MLKRPSASTALSNIKEGFKRAPDAHRSLQYFCNYNPSAIGFARPARVLGPYRASSAPTIESSCRGALSFRLNDFSEGYNYQ
jgi:hypothetical protein